MSDERATTEVDVLTDHHHYSGRLVHREVRLADILSDARFEVMELSDVVLRTEGVRSMELRCGHVLLKKQDVLLAIPRGSYEAPIRRRNNYQKRDRYAALIAVPGIVFSGVIYLPPRLDPRLILDENSGLPRFFGLTNVTVHGSIRRFAPSKCDTVIVRRGAIESVQLAPKPLPDLPSEPAPAIGTV
jgi:hypothetical protein